MKTIRTRLLTLVLVLTAVYCGAGRGTEAQAQQVVYPTYPIYRVASRVLPLSGFLPDLRSAGYRNVMALEPGIGSG